MESTASKIVSILKLAETRFNLPREFVPESPDSKGRNQDGFGYMFFSFKSLKTKSVSELKQLKNAGLRVANIGLESADENMLEQRFPKQSLDDVKEGIDKCQGAGIDFSLNVLVVYLKEIWIIFLQLQNF